jgi:hypothetical protein
MSTATQQQTQTIGDLIQQEAERFSLDHYRKPFAELDDTDKGYAIYGAKREMRRRGVCFPGECCDCGTGISEDQVQCYPCRKGDIPRAETWLHKREVIME